MTIIKITDCDYQSSPGLGNVQPASYISSFPNSYIDYGVIEYQESTYLYYKYNLKIN